jgi:hypothetical protein
MIFSENTEVIYRDMFGVIDFICDQYVVLKLKPKEGYNPPRLIVFREYYKEIQIYKASEK